MTDQQNARLSFYFKTGPFSPQGTQGPAINGALYLLPDADEYLFCNQITIIVDKET